MNGTSKRIQIKVTCSTCHERLTTVAKPYDRQMTCPECESTIKVKAYDPVEAEFQKRLKEPLNVDPGVYGLQVDRNTPVAAAPETVTLKCPICLTLLHPELKDESWFDTCPDCLESVRVPARDEVPKKASPLPIPDPGQYDMGQAGAKVRLNTKVFERISAIKEYQQEPPPNWTFFSSVYGYPWTRQVLMKWFWISVGWGLVGFLVALIHSFILQGGAGTIAAGFFSLPLIWIGFLTMSFTAACCLNILEGTSAGIDTIDEWPEPDWRIWMANLLYLTFLGLVSIALTTGIEMMVGPVLGGAWLLSLILVYLLFPIILLSSLEAGSSFIPLTRPVLAAIPKHFPYWLCYYTISAVLTTGYAALLFYSVLMEPMAASFWMAPVTAAFLLIQARLLGRLAWRTIVEPDGGKKRMAKMAKLEKLKDPFAHGDEKQVN